MSTDDLFQTIMGGNQEQPAEGQEEPDGLLSGLLAGPSPQGSDQEQASGDLLSGLLGGLLGGSSPEGGGQEQPSGDLLSGLLGSLLGGPSPQGGGQEQPTGDLLSTLLGGLGGSATYTSGLADSSPPGGPLGSGSPSGSLNQMLAPMIEQLTGNLGLSSGIAQSIVAFVLGKLLPPRAQESERGIAAAQVRAGSLGELAPAESLDVTRLLEQAGTEQGVDQDYLRSTSLPEELAKKAGLDVDTAVQALQQVLAMLMGQKTKRPARKRPRSSAKETSKPSSRKKPRSTAKTSSHTSTAKKPRAAGKKPASSTAKSKPKPKTAGKTQSGSNARTKRKSSTASGLHSGSTSRPKPRSTSKTHSRSTSIEAGDTADKPSSE